MTRAAQQSQAVEPDAPPAFYADMVLSDCDPIAEHLRAAGIDVGGSHFTKTRRQLITVRWAAEKMGLSRLRWAADRERMIAQRLLIRAEADATVSPGRAAGLREAAESLTPEIERLTALIDAVGDKPPDLPSLLARLDDDYAVVQQDIARHRAARMPVPEVLQQRLLALVDELAVTRPQEERRAAEFARLSHEASALEQQARAALRSTLAGVVADRLKGLIAPLEADRTRLEMLPELAPPELMAAYRELEKIAALAAPAIPGPSVLDSARTKIGEASCELLDVCLGFKPIRASAPLRRDAMAQSSVTLGAELERAM